MSYYAYRRLTPEQRAEFVQERKARGYPPHPPPHPVRDHPCYMLTATCFDHAVRMPSEERRTQLLDRLFESFLMQGIGIAAWAVLPNHYHLLVHVPDLSLVGESLRVVHRDTATEWNAADGARGRQVWCRYTDRAIRSDRHYCVTLNYLHYNAVKHGWTSSPYDWGESSIHW